VPYRLSGKILWSIVRLTSSTETPATTAASVTLASEELCELARDDPAPGLEKPVSNTAKKAGFAGL